MAARLLAIMGSGETTPTMAKVHRQIFEQLDGLVGPAVLVDTPYGFQANRADITSRALTYFRQSVGVDVELAPLSRLEAAPALALEKALALVADARWVFSGPGSPTYAARQWRGTVFPKLLGEKLSRGGAVVFSSAAAVTLGQWAVPVYEIYKVGADVTWAPGLDLMSGLGLDVAVIAHFDNAEGGNHDTRYCYLGEERLALLEDQLPEDAWVLGVDEHTACVFDLEDATLTVAGLGTVTVRRHGRMVPVASGESVALAQLVSMARSLGRGLSGEAVPTSPVAERPRPGAQAGYEAESPFLAEVHRLGATFDQAIAERDAGAAMAAVFELESTLHAWAADTMQSDEVDRARAALRRMLARLGELAAVGLREPNSVVAPWVGALLEERSTARQAQRYADSDRIRDRLVELGVEVRDTPDGSQWELRQDA